MTLTNESVFSEPRQVPSLDECYFYHSVDLPGVGEIKGEWDLRPNIDRYLGHTNFSGKRVLDVGTASGFLTFHIERQGADLVSYDLSQGDQWDIVPFGGHEGDEHLEERRQLIRALNNSYWFSRAAHKSNSKMVYGTVYQMPREIGMVDISVFGSILLHLRDPFLALQNAGRLTRETMVVADLYPRRNVYLRFFDRWMGPWMRLLPNHKKQAPYDGWWFLTPSIVREYLGILGFPHSTTTFHWQLYQGHRRPCYTVVAHREARS